MSGHMTRRTATGSDRHPGSSNDLPIANNVLTFRLAETTSPGAVAGQPAIPRTGERLVTASTPAFALRKRLVDRRRTRHRCN